MICLFLVLLFLQGGNWKSNVNQGVGGKAKDVPSTSSVVSSSHGNVKKKIKTMDADVTILNTSGSVQLMEQPGVDSLNENTGGVMTQARMSREEEQCLLQAIVDCNSSTGNMPDVLHMDPITSSIMCQQTLEIGISQQHIAVPSGSVEPSKGGIEATPPVESQVTCRTEDIELPNGISTTEEIVSTDIPVPIDTGMVVEVTDGDNIENVMTSVAAADVVEKTPDFGYRSYAHNFGADAIIMSENHESDATPNVTGDELDLDTQANAAGDLSAQYTVHSGYSPKSKQNNQRTTPKTSPTIKKTKATEPAEQAGPDAGIDTKPLLKPANVGNSRASKVRTKDIATGSHNKKISPKKSPTVGKKLTTSKKGKLSKSTTSIVDSSVTTSAATKPKKAATKKSKSSEIKVNENLKSPSQETGTLSKHKKARKTKAKDDNMAVKSPSKPKKTKLSEKNVGISQISKTKSSSSSTKKNSHSKHGKKNIKLSVDEVFADSSPDELTKPKKHKSKSKSKKLSVDDVFADSSPDESIKPKKHKSKSKSKKSSKHKSTHSKILHSPSSLSSASSLCISPVLKSPSVKCKSSKSNKSRTKSSSLSPTLLSGKSSGADSHSPQSTGKSSKIKKSKSSSKKKSHSKSSVSPPKPESISPFSGSSSCSTDFVTNAFAEIAKAAQKEKISGKSNSKGKKHKSSKSHSKSSDMLLKVAHKKSKSGKKHGKSKSSTKKTKKGKSKSTSPSLLPSNHGLLTTAVTSPTTPLHILIPDNETHVPQRRSPPRSSNNSTLVFSPTYKSEISKHVGNKSPPKILSTKVFKHSSPGRSTSGYSPIRSPHQAFGNCLVKPSHVFAEPVRVMHNDANRKRDGDGVKHKEGTPSPQSATTCLSEETLFSDSGVGTDNNSNPDQQHARRIPSATESVTSEMLESHPLATSAHGLYSYGKREKHRKHMGWHYGSIKKRRRKYRSYSRPHGRISPAFVFELDALIHEFRALKLDGPEHSPFGYIYTQPPAKNHLSTFAKMNPTHRNTYLRPSYLAQVLKSNSQKSVRHKSSKKKKKSKDKRREKSSSDTHHCLVSPDAATSQSEISISEASPLRDAEDQTKETGKNVEDSNSAPASVDEVMKTTTSPEKVQSTQNTAQENIKISPGKKASKVSTRPRASRIQSFIDANIAMGIKLQPIAESVKLKKRNKSIRREDSTSSITSTTSNTAQTVKKTKKISSAKSKKGKKSPDGQKKGKKLSPKKSVKGIKSINKQDDTNDVPAVSKSKSPKVKVKTTKAKSPKKKQSKKKSTSPVKTDVAKTETPTPSQAKSEIPTKTKENSESKDKTFVIENVSGDQTVDKESLISPLEAVTNDNIPVTKDLQSKSKSTKKSKKTTPTKKKVQKGKTMAKGGKGKKKNSTSNKAVSQTSEEKGSEIKTLEQQEHTDDKDVEILLAPSVSSVVHSNKDDKAEINVLPGESVSDAVSVAKESEISSGDNKVIEDLTKSETLEVVQPDQSSEVAPPAQSSEVISPQQSLVVVTPQQNTGIKRRLRRRGKATHYTTKSKARANRLKAALAKANTARSVTGELVTSREQPGDETDALPQTEKNTDCLESTEIANGDLQNEKDLVTNKESESDTRITAKSNETADEIDEKAHMETSVNVKTDKESQVLDSNQCENIANESSKGVKDAPSADKVEERSSPKRRRTVLANKKSNSKPSSRSSSAESSKANKNVQSVDDVTKTPVEDEKVDGRTRKGKKTVTGTKSVKLKAMKDAIEASIENAMKKHSEEEQMRSASLRQDDLSSGKTVNPEVDASNQSLEITTQKGAQKRVAKARDQSQESEPGGSAKGTKKRKAVEATSQEEQVPVDVPSKTDVLPEIVKPVSEDSDVMPIENVPQQETGATPQEVTPTLKRQSKKSGPSAIKRQRVTNKKQAATKSKAKDGSENSPVESEGAANKKMQPVVEIANSESQMAESILEKVPKSDSKTETSHSSDNDKEPDVIIISDSDVNEKQRTSTGQTAGTRSESVIVSASEFLEESGKQATTKKKAALAAKASVPAKSVAAKPASTLTKPTIVKKKGDVVSMDESSIPLKKRKLMKQPLEIDVDYNCLR